MRRTDVYRRMNLISPLHIIISKIVQEHTRIDDDLLIRQYETTIEQLRKEVDEYNLRIALLDTDLKRSLSQAESKDMQVEEARTTCYLLRRNLQSALASSEDADAKFRNERLILTDELSAVLDDRNELKRELDDTKVLI